MLDPYRQSPLHSRGTGSFSSSLYPVGSSQFAGGSYLDGNVFSRDDSFEAPLGFGGGYRLGANRGFGSPRGRGSDGGGRGAAASRELGVDRGRGTFRGHGGDRGRGVDRGRGRGFGGDRGRGADMGRGASWSRGADRGPGGYRGGGRGSGGFDGGMPNSWAALAESQRGEPSYRGGGNFRRTSRGPSYTAENALADSQWICKICDLKTTGPHNLTDHLLGTKHKSAVDKFMQAAEPGTTLAPDFLFCQLCKISVTNTDNLISHLNGQKHQSNLHNYGKPGPGGLMFQPIVPTRVKQSVLGSVSQITDALIGLEFVTEFIHIDPPQDPHYECKVCDLVLIGGNLGPHLLGHKHRLKYIQEHRPRIYQQVLVPIWNMVTQEGGAEQRRDEEKARTIATNAKVRELAMHLEATEGRKIIQSITLRGKTRPTQTKPGIRTVSDPQTFVAGQGGFTQASQQVNGSNTGWQPPHIKPNPNQLSDDVVKKEYERRFGKDLKRPADQAALGGPPGKKPFIPAKDKMQYLLTELATTRISSEKDASLALQVSNNLTQALLSYRLNSFPAQ